MTPDFNQKTLTKDEKLKAKTYRSAVWRAVAPETQCLFVSSPAVAGFRGLPRTFCPFSIFFFFFYLIWLERRAGKAIDRLLHTFKDRFGKRQRPDRCGADSLVRQGSRHSAGLRGGGGDRPLVGGNDDQSAVQLGIF